MPDDGNM